MTRLVQMKVVGEPIILLTDVESDFDPNSTTASIGFLTRDPIGYASGRLLYEYVRSRVHRATDPSGLFPFECSCNCYPIPSGPSGPTAPYNEPSETIEAPTEAIARARCSQRCSSNSGSGAGRHCTGILDPLTTACSRMTGTNCPGCTPQTCLDDLSNIKKVIDSTEVPFWDREYIREQWTSDQCDRWVRKASGQIPPTTCFRSVNQVRWAYIFVGGHVAIRITMCDGTIFYIDNGWTGGSDGIFMPEEVNGFPYNWPVEGPNLLPPFRF